MDKKRIYDSIINRAKLRGKDKKSLGYYVESHHIIPKCVGGEDIEENLVLLTPKEHYLCHLLLIDIYPSSKGLNLAIKFMFDSGKYSKSMGVKKFSEIREKSIEYLKEINTGENNPMYGKKITEKHKRILSEANKGPKSKETKERMSKSQLGKKASKETREKLSKAHKGLKIHSEEYKKLLSERWKLNNPNKGKRVITTAKKVKDSNGKIYDTIKDCAKENGVSYEKMRKWIKNNPEKGFTLI